MAEAQERTVNFYPRLRSTPPLPPTDPIETAPAAPATSQDISQDIPAMLGAGTVLKEMAAAAPAILQLPEAAGTKSFLAQIEDNVSSALYALAALSRMCAAGSAQACDEWRRLAEHGPPLVKQAMSDVLALKTAQPAKVKVLRPEDLRELPQDHPARRLAVGIFDPPQAAGPTWSEMSDRIQQLKENLARSAQPPERLRAAVAKLEEIARRMAHGRLDPSRGTLTAEQINILASDDTYHNAMLAKGLPQRPPWKAAHPPWVDNAFARSIPLVNEKLCKGQMADESEIVGARYFTHEKVAKDRAVIDAAVAGAVGPFVDAFMRVAQQDHANPKPSCFCCGVPTEILAERSGRGLESIVAHAANVEKLFRQFAAGAADTDRADLFLRIVVPTYNAIHFDSRRCECCGKRFALRTLTAVEKSKRCAVCSDRLYWRQSKTKKRAKPRVDAMDRLHWKRGRGDEAMAAADRQLAQDSPWEEDEDVIARINDHWAIRRAQRVQGATKKEK